ncbi:MAG: 3-hydroxybutyrate dehydrogenase [Thermomonas sp.]|uniref:3-hydroxybutyrate dehydrogenase n=1 Tax=Thermomonas sp. TaxID=1971895 RepID=UPI001ECF59A2|nr:3-hydroxybutyrate dehydrogenase [Thermomonas sp.]MBV2209787.1 3-hydroxybutyrate dehydrogenase [Thermomonas sp.]
MSDVTNQTVSATTQLSLKGKTALVTGAASGIGKRIAEVFADAGANVVIADLKLEQAQATADAIASKGVRTLAVAMDVTDEAAVDAGFELVNKQLGAIDVLVSNAGIQIVAPLQEFRFSDWKKLIAVHLDGGFLTARAAMRQMIASKRGGSIVFMGSVHSKEASKLKSPYVAAKHGLEGLAKVIAKEGAAYNIRSNVICPGFVRTPLVEKQIPEQAQELGISEADVVKTVMLKDTVDGEFTTVDDVAQAALTFAAWPSNALTGQSLVVSHGWFMQ